MSGHRVWCDVDDCTRGLHVGPASTVRVGAHSQLTVRLAQGSLTTPGAVGVELGLTRYGATPQGWFVENHLAVVLTAGEVLALVGLLAERAAAAERGHLGGTP